MANFTVFPETHRKVIEAWIAGKDIEFRSTPFTVNNGWKPIKEPLWMNDVEYRVAPTKVKMYQILYREKDSNGFGVSVMFHESVEHFIRANGMKADDFSFIQIIQESMIEEEVKTHTLQTAPTDPCPSCKVGTVCRTPSCGRLKQK